MEAHERENHYLKELVHRLPCTVQSKADSTVKCYLQDGKGGKLFLGKTGKIRTSSGTNASRIIFTGLNEGLLGEEFCSS